MVKVRNGDGTGAVLMVVVKLASFFARKVYCRALLSCLKDYRLSKVQGIICVDIYMHVPLVHETSRKS